MTEALATQKLSEVESLVEQLAAAEQKLEAGYAHLGLLLDDVMKNHYWEGAYESFGSFMAHLSEKYRVGRAQLYNYRSTATALLEAGIEPEEMNKMGINKARILAVTAKQNGTVPAPMVEAALEPQITVKDVKKMMFDTLHLPPDENMEWLDLGFAFYVTDEERATFDDAMNAARHEDPPIPVDIAESSQRKQAALKIMSDYLSTHSEHVVVGGRGL